MNESDNHKDEHGRIINEPEERTKLSAERHPEIENRPKSEEYGHDDTDNEHRHATEVEGGGSNAGSNDRPDKSGNSTLRTEEFLENTENIDTENDKEENCNHVYSFFVKI